MSPTWLHEVKYDGYRMMLIREQDRVRLISRGNVRGPLANARAFRNARGSVGQLSKDVRYFCERILPDPPLHPPLEAVDRLRCAV
jgi:hypothetical protein